MPVSEEGVGAKKKAEEERQRKAEDLAQVRLQHADRIHQDMQKTEADVGESGDIEADAGKSGDFDWVFVLLFLGAVAGMFFALATTVGGVG